MTLLRKRIPGSRAWSWTAALLLLLVAVVMAGAACGGSSSEGEAQTTATTDAPSGVMASDFSGVTLDGQEVSLSQYRGKPLVLAFMASW